MRLILLSHKKGRKLWRKIFELLVREVRVARNEDGIPVVNIVYWFDKNRIAYESTQLLSTRLSVRNVITTIEREVVLEKVR